MQIGRRIVRNARRNGSRNAIDGLQLQCRRPLTRGPAPGPGPGRGSGSGRDFWAGPLLSQEQVGRGDEGGVAVPADEGTAFEVVEAEAGLQLPGVVFDVPTGHTGPVVLPPHRTRTERTSTALHLSTPIRAAQSTRQPLGQHRRWLE